MPPTSEEVQEWLRQEARAAEERVPVRLSRRAGTPTNEPLTPETHPDAYRAALGKWETADYVICVGCIVLILLVVLITVATAVGA